jgi:S-layer homology domain
MQLRAVSRRVAVLAGLLVAARSLAQQQAITPPAAGPGGHAPAPGAPSYGTTDLTYVRVTGLEFFPADASDGYAGTGGTLRRHPIISNTMFAPVHLPNGSIIDYLAIDFCDSLDPQDILLTLLDCGPLGGNCSTPVANVNSFGAPGCSVISTSGFHYQVNDTGSSFALAAAFQAHDSLLEISRAIVGYRLQVSPDPVFATFLDVPVGHSQHQFVEALAASGITAGCGSGNYCPDNPVTRGQMAVFLAKALGLHWPN